MLKLLKYPKRSANYLVRGTVAGTYIYESTGTSDEGMAERYLAHREAELFGARHLEAKPWATIAPEILVELRAIISRARNRSQKRRHGGCNVTFEYVKDLYLRQRGRCAISGLPFNLQATDPQDPRTRAFAPSLDRIDCKAHYAQGNVRLVCRIANYAMNIWGDRALLDLALGITREWEKNCAFPVPNEGSGEANQ